jgi:hypothetical protein
MGSVMELVGAFGNKKDFDRAMLELEREIYQIA